MGPVRTPEAEGDMLLNFRTAFFEGWCLGNGTAADGSLAKWRHKVNTKYYQVAHTMQMRPCFRARGGTCILLQPCPFRSETDGQGPLCERTEARQTST